VNSILGHRTDRTVLMFAIGLVVSIAVHWAALSWASLPKLAAPQISRPTELQIIQTPPPRPPEPRPVNLKPAAPRPRLGPRSPQAATPPVTATPEPLPVFIPGFKLTPGLGRDPVPPGPRAGHPAMAATTGPGDVPPGSADREPEIATEHRIPYPEEARRAGIEGPVRLRITVDDQGRVTAVKVLSGPGHGLNEAAREAILKFKFRPAMKAGAAVGTSMIYQYTFALE
jgi:protein TonB